MAQPSIDEIVKAIAQDFNTPSEVVLKMFEATWAEFSEGARIFDYLTVLVIKRVREDLRNGKSALRIGGIEQITVPPFKGKDDHERALVDRKHDDEFDAPPPQTPNDTPSDDKQHCIRPQCLEEVHEFVSFVRL
ncbi:hypothetical protein AWB78_06630 [Caballeronia calidae]|uniref:Uncharacterized protein n=1 Tax=Caballeronia calidae TaxID=1777139 RepID=A0A158E9M6_9BURK|nr:hypothetical protein AWB78_06630 [Caballeronia calidae]